MVKALDLVGQRFNLLTAIRRVENSKSGRAMWECECDCGNTKIVRASHLTHETIKSCGCKVAEWVSKARTEHGFSKSKNPLEISTYATWSNMRKRCNNPSDKSYPRYGGKGITVCEEWENSFDCFLADMGVKPSLELSIDRIDFTKGYSKDNCRWATVMEQASNKSNNRLIEYNGVTKHLAEWAREYSINYLTLSDRLEYDWTIEEALTMPLQKSKHWRTQLT